MVDEGDPNHPYAGRRGRHPADCNCPHHAKLRSQQGDAGDDPPANAVEPTPPENGSTSSASPPTLDSLLSEGETRSNIVPPLDPKKAKEKDKKGGEKPKEVKKFYLSPKLLKFIGNKVANITGIEGYRLDNDEAKDIAECAAEVGREKGWGFSAEMSLYLLLFIWLGIPTLEFGVKKFKERKEEKEKADKKPAFGIDPNEVTEVPP